jgi:hypothetical protein
LFALYGIATVSVSNTFQKTPEGPIDYTLQIGKSVAGDGAVAAITGEGTDRIFSVRGIVD